MELESWKAEFEGKKVLIWGYGMEGKSSYAFIRSLLPDQKLMIADSGNEDRLENIRKETSDTEVLSDAAVDFSEYDLILKSPGIVIPEGFPKEHLSGEAQLFLKHYRNQVIGVTGTKGKSTTTSLVHAVLSEKYRTHLVGNIGKACFDVIPDMQEGDLAAFELSCHQLEFCPYSPHAAVYLNLFEEHLDHYGTLERYGAAKANIFRHQQKGDLTILNQNLPYCREVADAILIGKDIRAEGNHLIVPGHEIDVNDCRLIGSHNYLNLAVAYEIGLRYGISDSQFLHAAANFQPLHHRLEDLGEFHG
ncbi:MAG: Mur ligase family protein, partial [Stecheria intestinalis]|nr:Mur ligase family protein [Stecheria intestinalis]